MRTVGRVESTYRSIVAANTFPMHHLLTILLLLATTRVAAQTVNYSFPEGYENVLSKKDYKYLVDESRKVIARNYAIASVREGVVTLQPGQEYVTVNLHNLIVKCAQSDKRDWPAIIEAHLSAMTETMRQQEELDPTDFASIKANLSLRVYPENFVDQNGGVDNFLVKKDLDETWTMVMLDLPSAFTPLPKDIFQLWGKTTDEVFAAAQQNVNKQTFRTATESIGEGEEQITVHFIENEDYGASLALDLLANTPEFVGEWGSVVAIPNKGIVDICKISPDRPVDFVRFIQLIQPIVRQSYEQHPQPVSTDFFWYYQGEFTRIAVVEKDGATQVVSPQGLTELMSEK